MILYDQDYNFLAISSETVSFLGYENIDEFISLHSDFADLLVPKEGKIYKFKNFSWVDFILYSGAPNKSAVIKTKDGSEVDIKLTVKELTLTHEMGNLSKFYAVRIINDQFVKIASKVNSKMKFESKTDVALSKLLSVPSAANSVSVDLSQENESQEEATKSEEELILNFPAKEELNVDVDVEKEFDKEEVQDQSPTLNFPAKEEFSVKFEEEIKEDSDELEEMPTLNFPKKEELNVDVDVEKEFDKASTNEDEQAPIINFPPNEELSSAKSEEANDLEFHLDENIDEGITLDFSQDKVQDNDNDNKEYNADLSFLKINHDAHKVDEHKEEVIKQIKDDLNEIDQTSTEKASKNEDGIIESGLFIRRVFDREELES